MQIVFNEHKYFINSYYMTVNENYNIWYICTLVSVLNWFFFKFTCGCVVKNNIYWTMTTYCIMKNVHNSYWFYWCLTNILNVYNLWDRKLFFKLNIFLDLFISKEIIWWMGTNNIIIKCILSFSIKSENYANFTGHIIASCTWNDTVSFNNLTYE